MAVELTVIVKGEDGKLLSGAQVTATPGNVTATTDGNGEAVVTVDGANRYQVTVSAGGKQQTVPFYVVGKQTSARLEVNLQYFKQLEQTKTQTKETTAPTPWYQTDAAYVTYGVAAIVVLIVLAVVIVRRNKRHHMTMSAESQRAKQVDVDADEVAKVVKKPKSKSSRATAKTTRKKTSK